MAIRWYVAKKKWGTGWIKSTMLYCRIREVVNIFPVPINYNWVPSHFSSSPKVSSASTSIADTTIWSDLNGVLVCFATGTMCESSSYCVFVTSCVSSSLFFGSSDRSLMASVNTGSELYGPVFRTRRKMLFTNLAMNRVSRRTGTVNLRRTLKTTLT